jgi:hypothetical protein
VAERVLLQKRPKSCRSHPESFDTRSGVLVENPVSTKLTKERAAMNSVWAETVVVEEAKSHEVNSFDASVKSARRGASDAIKKISRPFHGVVNRFVGGCS